MITIGIIILVIFLALRSGSSFVKFMWKLAGFILGSIRYIIVLAIIFFIVYSLKLI